MSNEYRNSMIKKKLEKRRRKIIVNKVLNKIKGKFGVSSFLVVWKKRRKGVVECERNGRQAWLDGRRGSDK